MTPQTLAGALAEEHRRLVFAAIVLGAADLSAVASRTGLTPRDAAGALRRLRDTGLVTGGNDALRVDGEWLRTAARTGAADPHDAPRDRGAGILRTFLRDGALVRLPAQRSRRRVLLDHIVARTFEPGARYPERAVDAKLRPWCDGGEADHVTLRRYLIDEMLLVRENGVYWRSDGP